MSRGNQGGMEFLAGLFIGGMLGALVGLLLAPQSLVPAVLVLMVMHVVAYGIAMWVFTKWAHQQ